MPRRRQLLSLGAVGRGSASFLTVCDRCNDREGEEHPLERVFRHPPHATAYTASLISRAAPMTPESAPSSLSTTGRLPVARGRDWR